MRVVLFFWKEILAVDAEHLREEDLAEDFHWFRVAQNLRAHDCAFERAQEELGSFGCFDRLRNFACRLCFIENSGECRCASLHNFFQAHAEHFILVRHLLAEIGDEAAATALTLFGFLYGPIYIVLDALERSDLGVGERLVQLLNIVFVEGVDDGETEIFLAGKVVVKGALRHIAGGQHFVNARGVVALFEHDVDARLDEKALGVLFG